MPIYEYYCPENHTVYQFFAKTLAQGKTTPRCPDNPKFKLQKVVSAFAITGRGAKEEAPIEAQSGASPGEDPRLEAAMGAMEREFAHVDENDPRAMGRMMRRMAELSGEKIEGEMEEVVRKLEEGADLEALEERLGGENPCSMEDPDGGSETAKDLKEERQRFRSQRLPPKRDPKLYDYE